jgi:hypothetical protein
MLSKLPAAWCRVTVVVIESAFFRCFLCGQRFSSDLSMHEGTFIPQWKVAVCAHCVSAHAEGIPNSHPAVARLDRAGAQPSKKPKGLIAWPPDFKCVNSSAGREI